MFLRRGIELSRRRWRALQVVTAVEIVHFVIPDDCRVLTQCGHPHSLVHLRVSRRILHVWQLLVGDRAAPVQRRHVLAVVIVELHRLALIRIIFALAASRRAWDVELIHHQFVFLLSQLLENGFTLPLAVLDLLNCYLLLFYRDLFLDSVEPLVLHLLFIVQFVHTTRENRVDLVFQCCDVLSLVIGVTDLRLELLPVEIHPVVTFRSQMLGRRVTVKLIRIILVLLAHAVIDPRRHGQAILIMSGRHGRL